MNRIHLLLCFVLHSVLGMTLLAQNTAKKEPLFFNKAGEKTEEQQAYYFRIETDTSGYYRSYYVSNNKLYFKGKLIKAAEQNENDNVYADVCYWYYKNGNVKTLRQFNQKGQEHGFSKYYYESGKLQKEIEFESGRNKNAFITEFEENGNMFKIFVEEFENNNNDWDLYSSDKSLAQILNGRLELEALNARGTSRYINIPVESDSYVIEGKISLQSLKENDKAGIIYGFKNWENYHYIALSRRGIYIGSVYEGINSIDADAMFCSSIQEKSDNEIKVLCNGEKIYFSVNGEVQYSNTARRLYGNNFGFVVSGNSRLSADKLQVKDMLGKSLGSSGQSTTESGVKSTGSGLVFSKQGHIVTNHHVVKSSQKVEVELGDGISRKSYNAKVLQIDETNDLAILQIDDPAFESLQELEYTFKLSGQLEVGTSVFTLGYPLALSGMGKEVKFTDGKISAKTGYDGAINSIQTTIPVQPGNSGGPVFNTQGQLIGVINASISNTDNVSYAIKMNYVTGLIDMLPTNVDLPAGKNLTGQTLEQTIKLLSKYVVLVKIR